MGTLETLAFYNNPTAIIVVLVIIVFLFGGSKIPEMMKGVGTGLKEFKKGMSEDTDDELRQEKEREAAIRLRVEEEMRKK